MTIPSPSTAAGAKLVIFDCDGTLVDSQHNIATAMRAAFKSLGLPSPGDAAIRKVIGLSLPEAMRPLAPDAGEHIHRKLSEAYREAFLALRRQPDFFEPLFPGARQAIEAMSAREDVLLGIATGKARRGLDALLDHFGLREHFVTLQCADDAPSKPHPGMVLRAMEETGMAPRRTLLVGDTRYDMEMVRAAGGLGMGVAWGYHPPQELTAAGAARIARDFAQVPGLTEAILEEHAA